MKLSIGTDCSGIEAPIEALIQLDIPFEHKWSCEIDKYAKMSIQANYHPQTMFSDITRRKHNSLPDVDVYVCGFPCQAFSLLGLKQGTMDQRSNIMLHCIKVIKAKLPKIFILENVKNFKHVENGEPFKYLLKSLKGIKNNNKEQAYNIYHDILNTKDYGIPQNRERIYIVGIMKSVEKHPYNTPLKQPTRSLEKFLHKRKIDSVEPKQNARKVIEKSKLNLGDNNVIACAGYGNYMNNVCPTLTCSTPMYLTKYKRYLSPRECLSLQGFPRDFTQVVSNSQLYKQAGNSMSVNVLKAIFNSVFDSIK